MEKGKVKMQHTLQGIIERIMAPSENPYALSDFIFQLPTSIIIFAITPSAPEISQPTPVKIKSSPPPYPAELAPPTMLTIPNTNTTRFVRIEIPAITIMKIAGNLTRPNAA
jgi:hypothetical protein